jgi:MoaA/NifB/PqqE/SkfB family radical SAM enzyme
MNNQDLLRGTARSIAPEAIARALLWIRGEGPYPFPTSIHLDLTLRCTARCVHCRQWTWPRHTEFSIAQLERLFSIFQSWGLQTLTLGGGNPLLHDNICAALRIAHEKNIKIGIISEGIDLYDQLADTICEHAEWVRFSLDGSTAEIHDYIRNAPGLFDKVIDSIRALHARHSALRLGVNCIVQKTNLHCLSGMIDLGRQLELDTVLFKIPHGEDPSGRYLPSAEEWKAFVEWVHYAKNPDRVKLETNLPQLGDLLGSMFLAEDVLDGKPVRSFYKSEQAHCFVPLFFLTCDSEGNMYPCDYLQADTRLWRGKYGIMRNEFCLGNVLEDHEQVLKRLETTLRNRIHELPANGYAECGCCTRFCQLNSTLTKLQDHLQSLEISEQNIIAALGRPAEALVFL